MKRIVICIFFCLSAGLLKAQTATQADSVVKIGNDEMIFAKVEIESSFPGGNKGWSVFLGNTLVYPPKAVRKKIEGQVVARFIVDTDGSLSNIEIVSGPKELWPAVLDALKQSPNWKPAFQHGKKVKSYKQQPFNFRLESR